MTDSKGEPDTPADAERAAIETLAEIARTFEETARHILLELKGLRSELAIRPTASEQTLRRRMTVVVLLLVGWIALMGNDHHVASCSPGARASKGVPYVAQTPPKEFSGQHLRTLLREPVPDSCDVLYPTHSHAYETDWPSRGNLLGLGIYSALMLALYLWAKWPARKKTL